MWATPRSGRTHLSRTVSGNGVRIDDQGSNKGVREMRIAVVGGTGLVGRYTVEALEREGHEVIVVARSRGVDVTTGEGLDGALARVESLVDVTNVTATDPAAAWEFFGTTTEHLLVAEQRAGVGHHVVLSIVGADRVEGNAHYAGKRYQEELVQASPVFTTILRATQFHEFARMVVSWTRQGDVAVVPPLLVQPVAASDVGWVLAEIATGPPQVVRLILPDPKPRIWSIWPDARWRREVNRFGWFRAGGTVPSASRWWGRSSCLDRARGSRRRPSTPGSRCVEARGMAKPLAAEKTHREGVPVPPQPMERVHRFPSSAQSMCDSRPPAFTISSRGGKLCGVWAGPLYLATHRGQE
jgi:hypothetical protein